MATIRVNLTKTLESERFPDGLCLGHIGEHNANSLEITLPSTLTAYNPSYYRVEFGIGEWYDPVKVATGQLQPTSGKLTIALAQDFTLVKQITIQVIAYNSGTSATSTDDDILAKSDVIGGLYFDESIVGEYEDLTGTFSDMGAELKAVANNLSSNYYTKTQIDTTVAGINDDIEDVEDSVTALTSTVNTNASNRYTKTEIDSKIATLNATDATLDSELTSLSNSNTGAHNQINNRINDANTSISNLSRNLYNNYYNKSDVIQLFSTNLTNYYNKTEIDTKDTALNTSLSSTIAANKTSADNSIASINSEIDLIDERVDDLENTYLDTTTAASTYLKKTDATSNYISKTDAASTYATKVNVNTLATKVSDNEDAIDELEASARKTYEIKGTSEIVGSNTYIQSVYDPTTMNNIQNNGGVLLYDGTPIIYVHYSGSSSATFYYCSDRPSGNSTVSDTVLRYGTVALENHTGYYRYYITISDSYKAFVPNPGNNSSTKVLMATSEGTLGWGDYTSNEVPTTSSSDNEKILQVKNGDPSWQTLNLVPDYTTSNDQGKVLTVTGNGTMAWQNVPNELPDSTASDANKVLTVTDLGSPQWQTPATGLPTATSSDEDKVLTVNSSGNAVWETPASGLPAATSSDEGKALIVNDNGEAEWNSVFPTYSSATTGRSLQVDSNGNLIWSASGLVKSADWSNGTTKILSSTGNGLYGWNLPDRTAGERQYYYIYETDGTTVRHLDFSTVYNQLIVYNYIPVLAANQIDSTGFVTEVTSSFITVSFISDGIVTDYVLKSGNSGSEYEGKIESVATTSHVIVPTAYSGNYGQYLKAGPNGYPEWSDTPTELPVYYANDATKVLAVNSSGNGIEWGEPTKKWITLYSEGGYPNDDATALTGTLNKLVFSDVASKLESGNYKIRLRESHTTPFAIYQSVSSTQIKLFTINDGSFTTYYINKDSSADTIASITYSTSQTLTSSQNTIINNMTYLNDFVAEIQSGYKPWEMETKIWELDKILEEIAAEDGISSYQYNSAPPHLGDLPNLYSSNSTLYDEVLSLYYMIYSSKGGQYMAHGWGYWLPWDSVAIAYVLEFVENDHIKVLDIDAARIGTYSMSTHAWTFTTYNYIPNEVPSSTASDANKVLTVNASGDAAWITPVTNSTAADVTYSNTATYEAGTIGYEIDSLKMRLASLNGYIIDKIGQSIKILTVPSIVIEEVE